MFKQEHFIIELFSVNGHPSCTIVSHEITWATQIRLLCEYIKYIHYEFIHTSLNHEAAQ